MEKQKQASPKWLVFWLVAVAVFMSTLDGSIVNVALPAIMKDLAEPLPVVEWILMIYLLTVSSLLLPMGRLSDIRGRRWVYCRGFLIFSLGSLLCATAQQVGWLIAARTIQAVGAAMLMACSPALVVDIFPKSERGRTLGMVGTVVAAGLTSGPALGGLLLGFFSWRVIFYVNIPIGLLAAVMAWRILKGGKGDVTRPEPFDKGGAAVLGGCFTSGILVLTHAHDWGYASAATVSLTMVCIVCALLLCRIESRSANPLFEPLLFRIRLFVLPAISAMILFVGLFIMIFLMPFYLSYPAGFSIDRVGYTMVIPFAFLFFVSPAAGALSDRIGSRWLCTGGMLIQAAALFSFTSLTADAPFRAIAWRLALMGIGTAVFTSPNNATVLSAVPLRYRGIASATTATVRNLGMVVGVALGGHIFNSVFYTLSDGLSLQAYGPRLEPVFMAAFRQAMLAGALVAIAGVVAAALRGPESRVPDGQNP